MSEPEGDGLDPARVEGVFRAANESIEQKRAALDGHSSAAPYLCECEDRACTKILLIDPAEYGEVRADPQLFLVAPEHPVGPRGEVVDRRGRYWVVRKPEQEARAAREVGVP